MIVSPSFSDIGVISPVKATNTHEEHDYTNEYYFFNQTVQCSVVNLLLKMCKLKITAHFHKDNAICKSRITHIELQTRE